LRLVSAALVFNTVAATRQQHIEHSYISSSGDFLTMRHCKSRFTFALLIVCLTASAACGAAAAPKGTEGLKPHDYRDKNFDYFVAGDPGRPRAAHTEFSLVLMGGGGTVDAAYSSIARHAGDGHIVILRAVSDDSFDPEDGDYGKSYAAKWGPVVSAETIVFHHREASFDPRVLAALRAADGIFLAGGDQANYIHYWKGTPVQDALNAHVRANRPIGGSSAGLAVLGHYSYTSLDGGSMESKIALGNPYDSGVTLENDFLHLRWLEDVITDTHFSRRSRLGRLIVFVSRINEDRGAGKAYGIGLDEKTAMLIGPDGVGRLAAGSAGSAWVVMPQRAPAVMTSGQPLTLDDIRIVKMDQGSSIDLKTRVVDHPAAETRDSIERGVAVRPSIASPIMMRDLVPANES
jgi:cyanophycinase